MLVSFLAEQGLLFHLLSALVVIFDVILGNLVVLVYYHNISCFTFNAVEVNFYNIDSIRMGVPILGELCLIWALFTLMNF